MSNNSAGLFPTAPYVLYIPRATGVLSGVALSEQHPVLATLSPCGAPISSPLFPCSLGTSIHRLGHQEQWAFPSPSQAFYPCLGYPTWEAGFTNRTSDQMSLLKHLILNKEAWDGLHYPVAPFVPLIPSGTTDNGALGAPSWRLSVSRKYIRGHSESSAHVPTGPRNALCVH